ncbi:hypothetical protein, partial [Brachyspira catarrhinii]|uniref:hypothetical protein n=1 Tax=Brachyspira catarrhinii TaxID=2528966 RepID=UPI0013869FD3
VDTKTTLITKTDIENMMKTVKNSDGSYSSEKNGEIVFAGEYRNSTTFSFASAKFSEANPNFSFINEYTTNRTVTHSASGKASVLAAAIGGTPQFKEYFGS